MSRPVDPAVLLWFLPPPGLTPVRRHLLVVLAGTIVALVAHPVPMGVSAITGMTLLAITRTLPPAKVLSGFSNPTVWLVFSDLKRRAS